MTEELYPERSNFIKMADGTEVAYDHDHVVHWFSTEVYNRIINLEQKEKERYFQLITDYGDLMTKILNDPNHVIFEFAQNSSNPWLSLEKHAEQSNAVVDYELPTKMIEEYTLWKLKKDGLI